MPVILHRLPFVERPSFVQVLDTRVRIKAEQIVVWVSLTKKGTTRLQPGTRRFPAILDTGTNYTFGISEEHLHSWAGFDLETLTRIGRSRVQGQELSLVALDAWLHANRPGFRDEFLDRRPFPITMDPGIAIYTLGNPAAPR